MTPVKLALAWPCAALSFACISIGGVFMWLGARFAGLGKWVLAP
jgi:hypothetical protein